MSIAQRVKRPISDSELNRRWEETRALMKKNDLDLIFTQGNNMHFGGYVRWFTDIPAENNFHMSVLFPAQGEMTLIRTSASKIPQWALRGVEDVYYAPFSPSLCYTADAEAGFAIGYIRKRNPKRVGYIGPALINSGFMLRVRSAFMKVE